MPAPHQHQTSLAVRAGRTPLDLIRILCRGNIHAAVPFCKGFVRGIFRDLRKITCRYCCRRCLLLRFSGRCRCNIRSACRFLRTNTRYNSLFSLSRTDYRGWAYGLKACGYATNPAYASKLIEIIELYRLYEYDRARGYDKFMAQRSGNDQPARQGMTLHPIHIYNDNYYLKARRGDTFKSIGKEVEISWRKLAKYNERDKNDVLQEGDIIYLKKKRKKADKAFKHRPHVVRPGESMYSIAQMYGIRLKSLYKKNGLSPDYQIRVGDQLKVY